MTHPFNTQLLEAFMETLESVVVCPYCMEPNQLDPPLCCCSEVHATEAWEQPNGEILLEDDLNSAAIEWMQAKETSQ